MSPHTTASLPTAPARPLVAERMRPYARTPFYLMRGARARVLARVPRAPAAQAPAPVFIIGCGRSGTTLLGELFAAHPEVSYLYEPYHLWAAIDPVTDFLRLYSLGGEPRSLLDGSAVTTAARRRFRRLMAPPSGLTLVEKSPINSLRIGYVNGVAPGARFVHIVRDGLHVAHSIEKMAAITRKMAFRRPLNEWWGVGDVKWAALARDGRAAGYFPDEVQLLDTDIRRGAYEWLVSLREADEWRARLGPRLAEVRYPDLIADPAGTLGTLAGWLGLSCPAQWLEHAVARVSPAGGPGPGQLALPGEICLEFNRLQARLGFEGRAVSLGGSR